MTPIDCGSLQDRMPDVAAGNAAWSAEESAHLAACESCALEWRLVQAARRLGGNAAGQIDTTRMAANVIAGVRGSQQRSRWRRASWVTGLAAAAILVVVLRINLPPSGGTAEPPDTAGVTVPPSSDAIPMAELDALDAEQLQAVLEHIDGAAGTVEGGGVPLMGDLDDQQLERVLRSLEG